MDASFESESENQRRVVVLGASGFLGRRMSIRLHAKGHQVTACCRRQSCVADFEAIGIRTLVGDSDSTDFLELALRDADVVYHFASSSNPSLNFDAPWIEFEQFLKPILRLIDVASRSNVAKIAYPSSGGSVYGRQNHPCTEDMPTAPRSPYAICKVACESLLLAAALKSPFQVDIYRIANPYGPDQFARTGIGVVAHWAQAVSRDQPVVIFGDGLDQRDFIFVDDACDLMEWSCRDLVTSEIYNVGTGVASSILDLVSVFEAAVGRSVRAIHQESRPADIPYSALDPTKIVSRFGSFEFTTLEAGIRQTIQHFGIEIG